MFRCYINNVGQVRLLQTRQNKNRMVLMTFIWVVAMNYFEKVDLKFLVSGHSYMPRDRDFGIEKRKKVCKTMMPEEVADMIRDAKTTQPF
ncbi:hypothetical protein GE061_010535 [Apolygus lucorum]|uniref:DUF7869 domain-containing protein n=1 Tax=Apolygus lucorum TaxID=248454 RepID=A0A8S9XXM6_APOLU|nr:hypothetical protein GE061_010535 [Apolygus lucorum]